MYPQRESPFVFPCSFPIKAMGRAAGDFDVLVAEIVRKHVRDLSETAVTTRRSRGGRYLAVTVTVEAESQAQLDAIYRKLSSHRRVVLVL
ncbi:MAG: YbeD family protein [Gammaproteobacteria bacterium]